MCAGTGESVGKGERRKAGSPVEAGSWAWNEEFHDWSSFFDEALSGQKRFLECILERRARVRLFFIYQMD